jgi:hypothetical protein
VEASAPASRQAFRNFRCHILVLASAIGLFALNGINRILNNQQDAW